MNEWGFEAERTAEQIPPAYAHAEERACSSNGRRNDESKESVPKHFDLRELRKQILQTFTQQ